MKQHMSKLGLKVKDAVTGFTGVCTAVSFDLYGCVQCIVTPDATVDKEKKQDLAESRWLDEKRLIVRNPKPVMPLPSWDATEAVIGPEAKPRGRV